MVGWDSERPATVKDIRVWGFFLLYCLGMSVGSILVVMGEFAFGVAFGLTAIICMAAGDAAEKDGRCRALFEWLGMEVF